PFNITFSFLSAHDNVMSAGNSNGLVFYGARNSKMQHCVAYGNSDTGMGSQGPLCDNNVWEDCVAFAQVQGGNSRGYQFNNTRGDLLAAGWIGGRDNVIRRCIAFDNAYGRGFVDGNGSQNCRYLNCIAYRNGGRMPVADQ